MYFVFQVQATNSQQRQHQRQRCSSILSVEARSWLLSCCMSNCVWWKKPVAKSGSHSSPEWGVDAKLYYNMKIPSRKLEALRRTCGMKCTQRRKTIITNRSCDWCVYTICRTQAPYGWGSCSECTAAPMYVFSFSPFWRRFVSRSKRLPMPDASMR